MVSGRTRGMRRLRWSQVGQEQHERREDDVLAARALDAGGTGPRYAATCWSRTASRLSVSPHPIIAGRRARCRGHCAESVQDRQRVLAIRATDRAWRRSSMSW